MIHAKVKDETKKKLEALAGSPRKVGVYLDRIVAILFEEQKAFEASLEEAQRGVIAATIAKSKTKVATSD